MLEVGVHILRLPLQLCQLQFHSWTSLSGPGLRRLSCRRAHHLKDTTVRANASSSGPVSGAATPSSVFSSGVGAPTCLGVSGLGSNIGGQSEHPRLPDGISELMSSSSTASNGSTGNTSPTLPSPASGISRSSSSSGTSAGTTGAARDSVDQNPLVIESSLYVAISAFMSKRHFHRSVPILLRLGTHPLIVFLTVSATYIFRNLG
jgi:hypothetical protein